MKAEPLIPTNFRRIPDEPAVAPVSAPAPREQPLEIDPDDPLIAHVQVLIQVRSEE